MFDQGQGSARNSVEAATTKSQHTCDKSLLCSGFQQRSTKSTKTSLLDGQYSIRTWYDWINDNPGISRLTFFRWLNDHGALPLRRFFPQRRCATLCQPVIVLSSSLHATIDQQISSNIDRYQQISDIRALPIDLIRFVIKCDSGCSWPWVSCRMKQHFTTFFRYMHIRRTLNACQQSTHRVSPCQEEEQLRQLSEVASNPNLKNYKNWSIRFGNSETMKSSPKSCPTWDIR